MDTALFEGTRGIRTDFVYTVHLCPDKPHPSAGMRPLKSAVPHTSHRENLASYLCFIVLKAPVPSNTTRSTTHSLPGTVCFWTVIRATSTAAPISFGHLNGRTFYGPNMPGIYEKYTERGGLACFRPQSLAPYQKILDSLCETAASSDYVRDMKILSSSLPCFLC